MGKLEAARLKRGWSAYTAAREARIGLNVLHNAELSEADGALDRVAVRTAVRLLEAYAPDVSLADFVPDTALTVTRE